MEATRILMSEHRIIEQVLDALEITCDRLDRGDDVDVTIFTDAVRFIRGFADGCHHQKEEDVLFPAMIDAGIPARQGPVAVMLAEHEQGRAYTQALLDAAERLRNGEPAAGRDVTRNGRGYVALLRAHIGKEDNILFPLAAQVISEDRQARVAADFATIQCDVDHDDEHDSYEALADSILRRARRA